MNSNINIKNDFNIIGGILIVLSVAFIVPFSVALLYHEQDCAFTFLTCLLISCFTGIILRLLTKNSGGRLKLRDGFFTITSIWIIIPLFGALPYILTDSAEGIINCLFESYSGFTSTGASVISDIEALPQSILFWRAFTSWLGGFAILVLAGSLIPWINRYSQNVTIESSSAREKTDQMSDTVTHLICFFYIGFTILMTLLLLIGGNSLFDSICHTFSTISTGGFSIYDDGFDHMRGNFTRIVTLLFMFLAASNYNVYIMGVKHGFKTILKNAEFKLYAAIILSSFALIFTSLSISGGLSISSLGNSIFQVVSILTTTGFTTTNYEVWPDFAMAILLMLFFIGGCMGSTGGGIKVFRILILLKLVKKSIAMRLHPNAVSDIRISDKSVASDTVIKATSFILLYFVVFLIGSIIISFDNLDFLTTISSVISCLGNIGPGFGLCEPGNTYLCFSGFSKLTLIIMMLAGRLELFTFLAVFSPFFWNTNR